MQIIKQPIGGSNQFGTADLVPNIIPSNPVLGVLLVGQGGVGNGSPSALDTLINSQIPQGIKDSVDKYNFIWICPQTGAVYNQGEIDFAISMGIKRYGIDTKRIYGAGFSLGGGALFGFVMQSLANAQKFAAIVPMATTWPVGDVHNIANAGLPTWASHNIGDTNGGTPYAATVNTINAINSANPKVKAAYTGFNLNGHGSWGEQANASAIPIPVGSQGLINPQYNIYEWFLANSIGNPVAAGSALPSQPPVTQSPVKEVLETIILYKDGTYAIK